MTPQTEEPKDLGYKVKMLRETKGIKRSGLAVRASQIGEMNVSRQYIGQVEDGEIKEVGHGRIALIAAALEVTVGWLITGTKGQAETWRRIAARESLLCCVEGNPLSATDQERFIEIARRNDAPITVDEWNRLIQLSRSPGRGGKRTRRRKKLL